MKWNVRGNGIFEPSPFIERFGPPLQFFSLGKVFGLLRFLRGWLFFLWTGIGCMCHNNGELVDHLLIHCDIASPLWGVALQMFGIQWVCQGMLFLCYLAGETGLVSLVQIFGIWCWLVQKQRNSRTFEEMDSSLDQLKALFACTLFDWSQVWGFTQCSSILEFQVSLRFAFLSFFYLFSPCSSS